MERLHLRNPTAASRQRLNERSHQLVLVDNISQRSLYLIAQTVSSQSGWLLSGASAVLYPLVKTCNVHTVLFSSGIFV